MSLEVPIIILILGILIYFVLNWILKRYITNSKSRIRVSIIGAIFLAPVSYLLLAIAFFSFLFYEPQYDFDEQKWFADKNGRFEMRDDIVESEMLKNKDKTQIVKLIGKPDTETSDVWTYDLGMSGAGFGWQFNSLKLTFKNGKVSEVKKIEIVD
jgi:hypothetical protein